MRLKLELQVARVGGGVYGDVELLLAQSLLSGEVPEVDPLGGGLAGGSKELEVFQHG